MELVRKHGFAVFARRPGEEWSVFRFNKYVFDTLAEAEVVADRLNRSRRGKTTYRAGPYTWREGVMTRDEFATAVALGQQHRHTAH